VVIKINYYKLAMQTIYEISSVLNASLNKKMTLEIITILIIGACAGVMVGIMGGSGVMVSCS